LYSYDSIDPFGTSKIDYFKTNSEGEISFPHTKFTIYGEGA